MKWVGVGRFATATSTTTTTLDETTEPSRTTRTEWITVTECYNITTDTPTECDEPDHDDCVPFSCDLCEEWPDIDPRCSTDCGPTEAPECSCSDPACDRPESPPQETTPQPSNTTCETYTDVVTYTVHVSDATSLPVEVTEKPEEETIYPFLQI